MLDLCKKRSRLLSIFHNYHSYHRINISDGGLVNTTGVLNVMWNSWNLFWREYWLAHIQGGLDVNKNRISPILPNYTDAESSHYLLYKLGKRRTHNRGDVITGTFQEPTWGAAKVIEKLASELHSRHYSISYLSGLFSSYSREVEHFQQIRNVFAHLNNENVAGLNNISAYYTFPQGVGLIDILDAINISTNKPCFTHLKDIMEGLVLNI